MTTKLPHSSLLEAIRNHDPDSTAIVESANGRHYTYRTLSRDVFHAKTRLLKRLGRNDISGERVAMLIENGYNYVGKQTITRLS